MKEKRSIGKKLGIVFGGIGIVLVLLLVVGYFLVGDYFYNFAINPESTLFGGDSETEEPVEPSEEKQWLDAFLASHYEAGEEWTRIESTDQLRLQLGAYVLPRTGSHRWVITVHGYRGCNADMAPYAKRFFEDERANVLMPALRGHAGSEGEYIGMGWHDRLDVLAWIDWIVEQDPKAVIALHGVSMGGATVMMTTGETLPANVVAAIEDCGYTSVYEQFEHVLNDNLGLPSFPIMQSAGSMVKWKAGYGISEASSLNQLCKSVTPTLFIHGEADAFVPFSMLDRVYDACACEDKEKLAVPEAAHAESAAKAPELYWSAVRAFLSKHW